MTRLPARRAGRVEAGDLVDLEELGEEPEVAGSADPVEAGLAGAGADGDLAAEAAGNSAAVRVADPAETPGFSRGEAGLRGKRSIVCDLVSTINIRIPR